MAPSDKQMGSSQFLLGSRLTYVDFYMTDLCDFLEMLCEQDFYSQNPNLSSYVARIKSIPSIKDYINRGDLQTLPFNNKNAFINS